MPEGTDVSVSHNVETTQVDAVMAAHNPAEVREWLEILHGDSQGYINICSTLNWRGKFYKASSVDEALELIAELDALEAEGIYLRATTLREKPQDGRGGDDLSWMLPGLWADIDLAGPGHKSKGVLPPDVAEGMRVVAESGLPEPSHWIHSGGGLYPWWLLRDAVAIDDIESFRSLSAGWQKAIERSAIKLGYTYGSGVGDLSRVLRIPGTVNRKAGLQRPCTALEGHAWSGPTYTLDELFTALDAATPAPPPPSKLELRQTTTPEGLRPGDDFEQSVTWHDLLLPAGWQWVYKRGDKWHLRRPGKTTGTSATLSDTTGNLFVFSEECHPLQAFQHYSKFAYYTYTEHHGNFREATKDLAAKGFGTPRDRQTPASLLLDSAETVAYQPKMVAQPDTAVPDTTAGDTPRTLRDQVYDGYDWTQLGLAAMWADVWHGQYGYDADNKRWMTYSEGVWIPDRHQAAKNSMATLVERLQDYARRKEEADPEQHKGARAAARKMANSQAINGALSLASARPKVAVTGTDFDQDKKLVALHNGTLNLATKQLQPHKPSDMLTRKFNASFDPECKEGRWTRFMEEVLPNPEVRKYLQKICGYALTGTLNERVMVLIHGESGTGKTQFLEALKAVVGDFGGLAPASAFQPRTAGYKGPSEDLHKLMGKRFVLQSELDSGTRLNESLVKSIVGADSQTSRPMYGAPVDWVPEYTVFMATNYLPRISSSDNAIWNRVKPVKFEQVFINSQGRALDPSSRNLGRHMAETEPEVILNWLLEGLAEYEQFGLEEPAAVQQWLEGYREDVDVTRQFITEAPDEGRIVVEETQQIGVRELYRIFAAWCHDNAQIPLGNKNFNERMQSNGWVKVKKEKGIMWQGLGSAGFVAQNQTPVAYPRRF